MPKTLATAKFGMKSEPFGEAAHEIYSEQEGNLSPSDVLALPLHNVVSVKMCSGL